MNKINESLQHHNDNWNNIVKKQVTGSLHEVNDNISEVQNSIKETREQAAKHCDKEHRRNNVILYKVNESDLRRADDRNKADISFCLQLFNNCLNAGIDENDLVNVFRLGRREDNTSRPLMVQFASYTSKNQIMESLYRLKHAAQKYKNVIVAHDMTKLEQEKCRRLVEEAKAKEEEEDSAEYLYWVWGPPGGLKIVKTSGKEIKSAGYVYQCRWVI